MRYLRGTTSSHITYKRGEQPIRGYSDADWANDVGDRRSIGGFIYTMASGPICWAAKKQAVVSRSSTEAKYIALGSASKEALWLISLAKEAGVESVTPLPMVIYEDNQSSIKLARKPVNHNRTKHIDVTHHAIREAIENGTLELEYIPTKDMLADCMTKPLNGIQIRYLSDLMGLSIS